MKKFVGGFVVLALLGLIGWRVYQKLTQEQGPNRRGGSRAVAVAIEPVRRQTIHNVAEFTGTLVPRSQFVVAPKVAGRLEKLHVNIGDTVQRNTLIAVLDSDEYAQQVAQARAELEVSKANLAESVSALAVAESDFDREKKLYQEKISSEAERDQAEALYLAARAKNEVAQAQIKQKEAALKTAEVRLSYTRISASWDVGGDTRRIAERFVDEGALLRASDPIVSVVDLSTVTAVINVIERDFPHVRIGQEAEIATDAWPNRTFTGKIVRLAPVLKEESRQARVEIEVPNPGELLAPGMFVRARIHFEEHPNAIVVPVSAIVRRDSNRGVFLVDRTDPESPKGRFVPLTIGITDGDMAEVLDPPLMGDVVTLGHHLLEDGAAIVVPDEQKEPVRNFGAASAADAKRDDSSKEEQRP